MSHVRTISTSRRALVLEYCENLVRRLGRGFVFDELVAFIKEELHPDGLDRSQIQQAVASLLQTEDLVVVRKRIGGGAGGTNIYAPARATGLGDHPFPLTWLEQVLEAVHGLWRERKGETRVGERRPQPVTTGDVRRRMKAGQSTHENLENPQLLSNALQQLSKRADPLLRKVKLPGQRQVFWAPAGVADEAMDLVGAFATDTDRMVESVTRAQTRLGMPAVILESVQDEIDRESALRPARDRPLYKILSDLSRTVIAGATGERRGRVEQKIHRAGLVDGRTYFSVHPCDEWQGFMDLREAQSQWDGMGFQDRLVNIQRCPVPAIAAGRGLLLRQEVDEVQRAVSGIDQASLPANFTESQEVLRGAVELAVSEVDSLVQALHLNDLPELAAADVPGLTASGLQELLSPLYPRAREVEDATDLVPLLARRIRRVPNPDHVRRFAQDESVAAEYLFDSFDTRTEAALRWGGPAASVHANQARAVMGRLRDVRFPLRALKNGNLDHRLLVVSCLGFLGGPEALDTLRHLVTVAPEPGVRVSAAWAYGFAGGEGGHAVVQELVSWDDHPLARDLARRVDEMGETGWWGV